MQAEQDNIITLVLVFSATVGILIIFFLWVIINNYRTNVKRKIERLQSIIDTQESERFRIGKNLHDEIGMCLSSVKIHVDNIYYSETIEDAKELAVMAKSQLDDIISEVRVIVRNIIPHNIGVTGLVAAIKELISSFVRHETINITFEYDTLPYLSVESQVDLYRVIQELLSNALKYSHGDSIAITLKVDSMIITLLFSDNGRGFDTSSMQSGMGLKNLRSRVALYSGSLEVISDLNHGTQYTIRCPIKKLQQKI